MLIEWFGLYNENDPKSFFINRRTSQKYKLNKEWSEKLVKEGYEVFDMGDIPFKAGDDRGFSLFYSMEKNTIFK
jgi:hypothetical protein